MKQSREFEIAFVGLKSGEHVYTFTITDSFFDRFEKPEFWNAQIEVKLQLDKQQGAMLLNFYINGKATIACDRCADDYEMTLWDEFELLVKIIDDTEVEKKSSEDAEVAYIGRSESILDVSDWVYEFIILSVPIQHIHQENEDGTNGCNPKVIALLNKQQENQTIVWDDLNKLKI